MNVDDNCICVNTVPVPIGGKRKIKINTEREDMREVLIVSVLANWVVDDTSESDRHKNGFLSLVLFHKFVDLPLRLAL